MKFKKIFLAIFIIVVLLIILPFIITPLYNNWCLNKFSQQLLTLPLSEETSLIADIKQCGKLSGNGNGNGIDFLAVLIIRSEMSLIDLELYYDKFPINEARTDKNPFSDPPTLEVYPLLSSKLDLNYINSPILINDTSDFSNTYVVILFDGGYNADFDIRGH